MAPLTDLELNGVEGFLRDLVTSRSDVVVGGRGCLLQLSRQLLTMCTVSRRLMGLL